MQTSVNAVVRIYVEHILNSSSFSVFSTFRYFIDLQPETTSLGRKEQHSVVHRGGIYVFNEVFITNRASFRPHSTASLRPEICQRRTFNVTQMTNGYDHFIIGIEIFGIKLLLREFDFTTTLIAIFFLHFNELIFHYFLAKFVITQNLLVISDLALQFFKFLMKFVLLDIGELCQSHIHNGLCLNIIKLKTRHQILDSSLRRLRTADDAYHLINIIAGNDKPFKNMSTFLSFAQIITCTAYHDIVTMLYKMTYAVLKRQRFRTAMHQSNAIDREARLKRCHFKQFVENDIGIGIAFHIHHNTHTFAVTLIVHIGNTFNPAFIHEVGYRFDQLSLIHAIRNFIDNYLVMGRAVFYFSLSTHHHTSATGFIGTSNALHTHNISARGKIRGFYEMHQILDADFRIINIGDTSVNNLSQIVGRHISSHTHGNTAGPVHKKVGNTGRHDRRLHQGIIEIRHHVHSLLVKILHHCLTDQAQPCFSITHGRCRVTIHRTEVSLSVHQRITHVPILCHTH